MDAFEDAQAITRHFYPTLASEQWRDGTKPRCRWCFVPCDPRSRTYRATHLCEWCYGEQPIILEKKELLCRPLSPHNP